MFKKQEHLKKKSQQPRLASYFHKIKLSTEKTYMKYPKNTLDKILKSLSMKLNNNDSSAVWSAWMEISMDLD